ncbi:DUF397 domain-containing protein [Actinomadura kijaniata]|uniref:DUF397 domain-containing protein n=1 Tax=Actinomadura kijaniata TaxID=46161 RepID=UPI0008368C8C|nr:DUF397 domain-containing protein [Actinomadura kijaniata]
MTINWRKSSHSGAGGGTGGDCVELADLGLVVGVRDSTDPHGPRLELDGDGFAALIGKIKRNEPAEP